MTEAALYEFAKEHLFYEVDMFVTARASLSQTKPVSYERNFVLEVSVLHFRNLVDFFYLEKPKPDDVVAGHYVADWANRRPKISDTLNQARDRANKEMAHLTTERIAGSTPEKSWDFDVISAEFGPVIAAFNSLADPSVIPPNVSDKLRMI